ncbi:GNAT family N-acetyltransferase [Roseovarius sp. CAU 1744]|uniref:GNAT family N-acetyltransferase n=1 Tax=Roseovarius sp. CAU 1744 TaxID=3140368 RepID=UPI00325AF7BC
MASLLIRPPHRSELDDLSALKIRSKAYWGYDADFMQACAEELTLRPEHLTNSAVAVGELDGTPAGVARVSVTGQNADLLGLFIDPPFICTGIGQQLFCWCVTTARELAATRMLIEADPGAAGFYERMGARRIGSAPSESIPGRILPLLEFSLR